ncbi:hypothetical protein DPMN_068491 [Dreissena polymorpha]|uniref:Uncharacterized protein n=1 Tax=Dreissena polymorpha TaxID=45954 RepID=A0A9D3Z199_DREPO|nr:hypothetical protein DPMN_068491 [Dreissena polymorpha]
MGDSPADLLTTEIALYTVGVTWNSSEIEGFIHAQYLAVVNTAESLYVSDLL